MAAAAGFNFRPQKIDWKIAPHVPAGWIMRPYDPFPLVQASEQALAAILLPTERPPALLCAGPGDVVGPLPMTGLAAHADLGPRRCVAVAFGVVILPQSGRMTLGAHEVPVLIKLRPMQNVVVPDIFTGIEMKPALPAFFF